MTASTVDVETSPDGTLVIQPHGVLDADDPINLGTLVAACHLGDDHQVAVFLDRTSESIASRLSAAGVANHRLRHVAG